MPEHSSGKGVCVESKNLQVVQSGERTNAAGKQVSNVCAGEALSPLEQSLMAAEKSFVEAAKKGDIAYFKRMLTDDFSYVRYEYCCRSLMTTRAQFVLISNMSACQTM